MRMTDRRFASLMMLPAGVFLLAFVGLPLVRLFIDSLYDVKVLTPNDRTWVALENYADALSSPRFLGAVGRTIAYTAMALSLEFALGLMAALVFEALGRRSAVFRTIFAFPLMIAPIVAGLLWRFLLIDDFGIINEILVRVGVLHDVHDIGWLSDPGLVLFTVVIPDVWLTTSFIALVLFAGLQAIPSDILEAARTDGASGLQGLLRIKLPLLRPVIAVALIIRGIDAARAFDVILVMTEGGPQSASEVLSFATYRQMIRFGNLGYSSAMATLFLVGMMMLAIIVYVTIWRPAQQATRSEG